MTLLVGLILLLTLTVISTIAYRNTTMSERMTGNAVDRNVSFQSSESAGKEALGKIDTSLLAGGAPLTALAPGYYSVPIVQGGTTSFWTQGDGVTVAPLSNCATTAPFSWKSCSIEVGTIYEHNANKAQYVIELLKPAYACGASTCYAYRVTSRSTGGSGNADVVLQTNYIGMTTP